METAARQSAIWLRFYAELNEFLAPGRRHRATPLAFNPPAPIGHLIQTLGVPHTEVELILANGLSVGWDYRVRDADRVSVYPVFERFDVTGLLRLRDKPLRDPRFVADAHLGKLARHLRMLGFDTRFYNSLEDAALAELSAREQRILLTRDRALLMRKLVTHGCYIRSRRPGQQLQELMQRLDLYSLIRPFTRCMACNGRLLRVGKGQVAARLPPNTRRCFEAFWECRQCHRVYWKGSHYQRMLVLVERYRCREAPV